jgi:hypothetical protein
MQNIHIKVYSAPRLRVRKLDEINLTQEAINKAKELGRPYILCKHGGSVNNSYGYPAETEGGVAVGFPDGSAWCSVDRLPANKVTYSGVFKKIWGEAGLFDCRFSNSKKNQVKQEFLSFVKRVLY